MNDIKPDAKSKKSERIITVLLVVICIISAIILVAAFIIPSAGTHYTATYADISPEAAYNLINTTNITVIDCRGLEGCSPCQFGQGHLPLAVQDINAASLFNTTNDIIVYSKNGTVGAQFCQELVGHVYGKIYNLEGGYESWKSAKFPDGPYTSYFVNISPEIAYDLINKTSDLEIIDCRGLESGWCNCHWDSVGHLPNATLNANPSSLYNSTNDILVYSTDGTKGAEFSQALVDHVYGKIYNLDGGFSAWYNFLHP